MCATPVPTISDRTRGCGTVAPRSVPHHPHPSSNFPSSFESCLGSPTAAELHHGRCFLGVVVGCTVLVNGVVPDRTPSATLLIPARRSFLLTSAILQPILDLDLSSFCSIFTLLVYCYLQLHFVNIATRQSCEASCPSSSLFRQELIELRLELSHLHSAGAETLGIGSID